MALSARSRRKTLCKVQEPVSIEGSIATLATALPARVLPIMAPESKLRFSHCLPDGETKARTASWNPEALSLNAIEALRTTSPATA